MSQRRFALIDRDGTINVERDYLSDPNDLELIPGAAQGLRKLQGLGLGLAVVTNQSGIARGYFSRETLKTIHQRLQDMLASEGIRLDGLYFCPHGPDEDCQCRKPLPGMAFQAAKDLNFDLREAFVIGDKAADVDLGKAVGAASILVRTGYGRQHEAKCRPDHVADDLLAAAQWIALQIKGGDGN
ncbi:D-glycero-beta-D-manno-heptose-1,7-bisphosphate 7-phosphatase [Rhodospirillaceae bacterium LM-1]|nr:D-glycero-beta-D-manno-heptose-1,7-bisphosphate 7-phosphatase [Rhodospirillaceae bacterium LM-1]